MIDRLVDPIVRRMLHPPRRVPRPLPDDLAAVASDVTIPAGTLPLRGWLLGAGVEPRGVVLAIHGWGSDAGRLAAVARPLLGSQLAVLLIDLPGHGRTGPVATYDVVKMIEDIRGVRDWLKSHPELAGLRAGILGYSFGGVGAYASAARGASWDALALLATPSGPLEATRLYLNGMGLPGAWLTAAMRRSMIRALAVDPVEFDGTGCLSHVRVPVLVAHGAEDRVVPVEHGVLLASAVPGGRGELLRIADAGHDDLITHRAFAARLATFFLEALAR